jgi:hypothetical protein
MNASKTANNAEDRQHFDVAAFDSDGGLGTPPARLGPYSSTSRRQVRTMATAAKTTA